MEGIPDVPAMTAISETDPRTLPDDVVVARVLGGDTAAFELLMRRYNQRVFRAARSVLRDDAEAEDVAQDAWVRAYGHLDQFAGRAGFGTWVARIAIHEALARGRRRARQRPLSEHDATLAAPTRPPDDAVGAGELVAALEAAIDELPAVFRTVFVLRDVEGLDTAETSACLDVPEATVKTRLHRARSLLRAALDARLDVSTHGVFAFAGERCDRTVAAVLARIAPAAAGTTPATATAESQPARRPD
jgi:RNA polymerase sigma-70 factor (ECF subfamily)